MTDYEKDVEFTKDLFEFLQGRFPDKYRIAEANIPRLTPEQAETVIWYLGNLYWQVTDHVERCEVCGDWYNTWSEGETNDHAPGPIFVCGNCMNSEEAVKQRRTGRKLERARERAATSPKRILQPHQPTMSKSITRTGPECRGHDALLDGKLYQFNTATTIAFGGNEFDGGVTHLRKTPAGAYFKTHYRAGPTWHTDSFTATALTPEEARTLAFQLDSVKAAMEFTAVEIA